MIGMNPRAATVRGVLLFLLMLGLCSFATAYATNNYYFLGDSEGSPGDQVTIVVGGTNDVAIKGYSIVFVYDADVFDFVSSTLDGTRGQGAVIFTPGHTDSTARAGVSYSFSCPPSIPAGTGALLAVTLLIQSDAPARTTALDLRDVSPTSNRMTPCSGSTITPTLTDGTFEVLSQTPVCSVDPTALDFGQVEIGSSADLSFTITNVGGGTLSGTVTEVCAGFSILAGEGPYELSANEAKEVTLRFAPLAAGDYSCAVGTGTEFCESVSCEGSCSDAGDMGHEERVWITDLLDLVPNPSSGRVTAHFSLQTACATRVAVYDQGGRMVRRLVWEFLPPGPHSVTWEGQSDSGNSLPAGVYYIRLATPGETISRRVTRLD
jgi:hypothetical protein